MTTFKNTHRPPTFAVAASATGLVAALVSLHPSSAGAIPDPVDTPAVVHRAAVTDTATAGPRAERSCFITPAPLSWNVALDGPLPRCDTYLA